MDELEAEGQYNRTVV